jgi:hypothetical protein
LPSPQDFLEEQQQEEVKSAAYTLHARDVAVFGRDNRIVPLKYKLFEDTLPFSGIVQILSAAYWLTYLGI